METITLKRAIEIIKIHGNLDEIFYFFKECGHKSNYKLKDIDLIDADGDVWSYVIRYNNNEDDLALLDKKRYGKKLIFNKRGDYV